MIVSFQIILLKGYKIKKERFDIVIDKKVRNLKDVILEFNGSK